MEKYAAELTKKVEQELKKIDIPVSGEIDKVVINNRAKKRLGTCRKEKIADGKIKFVIELSSVIMDCTEKEICGVIAHELIHTCEGCFNHGKKWKEYAKRANDEYGYNIHRITELENSDIKCEFSAKNIYIIKCKNCGTVYKRIRMCPLVKNPERYRCGKCGHSLG